MLHELTSVEGLQDHKFCQYEEVYRQNFILLIYRQNFSLLKLNKFSGLVPHMRHQFLVRDFSSVVFFNPCSSYVDPLT